MAIRSAFLLLFALALASSQGAGLQALSDPDDYLAEVRDDPSRRLVDLREAVPGIAVDLRYATTHNFLRAVLYDEAVPLLRARAATRLREIEDELRASDLGLIVYDAYRPYYVTRRMWREKAALYAPYLSPPSLGSDHNRGIAVDVGLVDRKTGKPLPMPTEFDAFEARASHDFPAGKLSPEEAADRARLLDVMKRHGFHPFVGEWWHYALDGAKEYSVLDLPLSVFAKNGIPTAK